MYLYARFHISLHGENTSTFGKYFQMNDLSG